MDKDTLHEALIKIYNKDGISSLDKACWDMLELFERSAKFNDNYRELKGEVAETYLQCCLTELQKIIQPSIVLKSLCIPFITSGSTTELDLTLVTDRVIYLFECKSYMGGKSITDKCLIDGKMDVYAQSVLHCKALNQHLSQFYLHGKDYKPYKLILFEMSRKPLVDNRLDNWKNMIPVLNPKTFFSGFQSIHSCYPSNVWDLKAMYPTLNKLNSNSAKYFQQHMQRFKER